MQNNLYNKNIVLGVSGSIAAYKSVFLARLLVKAGANVQVIMTQAATKFITELTMQAITGRAVRVELFDHNAELGMSHIELAKWADLILIAPATANLIGKLASGIADDLLSTVCLALDANKKVYIAPAMNAVMWQNKLVSSNLDKLVTYSDGSFQILDPGCGEQACGDFGHGRMLEPEEIMKKLDASPDTSHNKQLLITAGPTVEPIDPVRYISNHSSGKMGYSIANAAAEFGYTVTLISGPVDQQLINNLNNNIKLIKIHTAQEMFQEVQKHLAAKDLFISVAAVADYKAVNIAEHKIKKHENYLELKLIKNPDILAYVGHNKNKYNKNLKVVGFAAETENVFNNAQAKLTRKKLDMIIINDVNNPEITFGSDQSEVRVLDKTGNYMNFAKQSKQSLARKLIAYISQQFEQDADDNKHDLCSNN